MELASVDDLLAVQLPEDTVELPGTGKAVKVRSLSRADVVAMRDLSGLDLDRFVLAHGVADPALTDEQAGQWLASVNYAVIEAVAQRIVQLSRLAPDSEAAAYKSVRGES